MSTVPSRGGWAAVAFCAVCATVWAGKQPVVSRLLTQTSDAGGVAVVSPDLETIWVGTGEKATGFGYAGFEGHGGRFFHVRCGLPRQYDVADGNHFLGFVIDYHTLAGYTRRVRLSVGPSGRERKGDRARVPASWGATAAPEIMDGCVYEGEREDPVTQRFPVDLWRYAPADWDGTFCFAVGVQSLGAGRILTASIGDFGVFPVAPKLSARELKLVEGGVMPDLRSYFVAPVPEAMDTTTPIGRWRVGDSQTVASFTLNGKALGNGRLMGQFTYQSDQRTVRVQSLGGDSGSTYLLSPDGMDLTETATKLVLHRLGGPNPTAAVAKLLAAPVWGKVGGASAPAAQSASAPEPATTVAEQTAPKPAPGAAATVAEGPAPELAPRPKPTPVPPVAAPTVPAPEPAVAREPAPAPPPAPAVVGPVPAAPDLPDPDQPVGRNSVAGWWRLSGGPHDGQVVCVGEDGNISLTDGRQVGKRRWWGQEEYTFIWASGQRQTAALDWTRTRLTATASAHGPGVGGVRVENPRHPNRED